MFQALGGSPKHMVWSCQSTSQMRSETACGQKPCRSERRHRAHEGSDSGCARPQVFMWEHFSDSVWFYYCLIFSQLLIVWPSLRNFEKISTGGSSPSFVDQHHSLSHIGCLHPPSICSLMPAPLLVVAPSLMVHGFFSAGLTVYYRLTSILNFVSLFRLFLLAVFGMNLSRLRESLFIVTFWALSKHSTN